MMRRGHGTTYVLGFTAAVCIVCSLAISGAALGLRPLQQKNIEIDKKKNVLAAAGLNVTKEQVLATFEAKVKAKVVDLKAGTYSAKTVAELTDKQLAADIYRMSDADANLRPVYLVGEGAEQVTIIPMAGKGLWSTVYGFLALKTDRNTVKGVTFYKHGETPGLGAECDKEWFTSNFVGKTLKNDAGKPVFGVAKGKANTPNCKRFGGIEHCVDGMSGATITSTGITELVQRATRDYSAFFAAQKG
jgi:Na+-transporting NADH:ubiquinone oxidoreductase subunit C